MSRPNPTIALLLWLTAAYAAGGVGALGVGHGVETLYPGLLKPAWTPPSPVFGPVWTALDALLGLAAWRVWRSEGPKSLALSLWWTALVLAALWPWAFFGFGRLGLAFGLCVALLIALVAAVPAFAGRDRAAAWMLVPAVLWVAFATTLNFSVWRLNAPSERRTLNTTKATGPSSGGLIVLVSGRSA